MDLGCIDMGCLEKPRKETSLENESSPKETSASRLGKSNKAKDAARSSLSALNKLTSQIAKPPRRKTSPINWFPRKKVEPYLKRKIKMLQEVDGMHSTLDETLSDSNPHYSKVLREKIAIREAAEKAMEARKAAMVEASWCRILGAARIESKAAEDQLSKAELTAAEAFEAARAVGVIMNDTPYSAQNQYKIETSANGVSTTHTVSATFETAFEVDKQVARAIKAAFIKLASCPSINKDDFKELLGKISENPDTDEKHNDFSEITSECESDAGSEVEARQCTDSSNYQDASSCCEELGGARLRKHKKIRESDNFNMANMVDTMLGRLKCLKEDQLASLATIVATSGLNAALAKTEDSKQHASSTAVENTESLGSLKVPSRTSLGRRTLGNSFAHARARGTGDTELPSLDKFLVKRLSRLEREILEAKKARKNEFSDESERKLDTTDDENLLSVENTSSRTEVKLKEEGTRIPDLGSMLVKHSSKLDTTDDENLLSVDNTSSRTEIKLKEEGTMIPDLGSMLVKHSSKLEKEVEEARTNGKSSGLDNRKFQRAPKVSVGSAKQDVAEVPSLDKVLVKHLTRLEREVQEARNRKKMELTDGGKVNDSIQTTTFLTDATNSEETLFSSDGDSKGKENLDLNKIENQNIGADVRHGDGLSKTREAFVVEDQNRKSKEGENKILSEPDHLLQRETKEKVSSRSAVRAQNHLTKDRGNVGAEFESLEKVLVKHVSRLEKEKLEFRAHEQMQIKPKRNHRELESSKGSLDQVLVKHKSRLEREKIASAEQQVDSTRHSVSRLQAREKELQAAWGGLSLGNSMKPHVSRLQREKAAWLKAEEEERKRAVEEP